MNLDSKSPMFEVAGSQLGVDDTSEVSEAIDYR